MAQRKILLWISMMVICLFTTLAILAQSPEDTADERFHDDLLNHLVGKWDMTSVAHGSHFTAVFEAAWVMNHQHLRIHSKSHEIIPWLQVQMEFEALIGYSHVNKRYIVHGMSVEGYDHDPSEGFCYGYRTANEFKTVAKFGSDSLIVQRYIWQPLSGTWNIKSAWVIAGKEEEPFLELKLVAVKPAITTKKKQAK